MTFDPKLSETVPLSMILDELLRSDEDPNVVMSFLEDTKSFLPDVLSRSIHASKMLNLDFFRKLDGYKWRKVLSEITKGFMVGPVESWLFIMQVSNTGKDAVRKELGFDQSEICNDAALRHPIPRLVRGNCLDSVFLEEGTSAYYVADRINSESKDSDFDDLLAMYSPFMFEGRICQEDFFSFLDAKKKFILVNNAFKNCHNSSVLEIKARFFLQLLCGDDEEVKFQVAKFLRSNSSWVWEAVMNVAGCPNVGELDKRVRECNSFPELYMDYATFGIDNSARAILVALLLNGKDTVLKEFAENEPEIVEKYLPVGSLPDRFLCQYEMG